MGQPRQVDYGPKTCQHCGTTFERPANQRGAQWAARRFCSVQCVQRAKSATARATWAQRSCAICGEPFGIRPGWNLQTCGNSECKIRYKREVAAKKQSATAKAAYASGARAKTRGYSELEERVWELLRQHGWVWRLKWREDAGWVEMDLAHFEKKINVELDGREHRFARRRTLDETRDAGLVRRGWTVVRIPNGDVDADPAAVAARILSL